VWQGQLGATQAIEAREVAAADARQAVVDEGGVDAEPRWHHTWRRQAPPTALAQSAAEQLQRCELNQRLVVHSLPDEDVCAQRGQLEEFDAEAVVLQKGL